MDETDEITEAIRQAASEHGLNESFANKLSAWIKEARKREMNEADRVTHLENVIGSLDANELESR